MIQENRKIFELNNGMSSPQLKKMPLFDLNVYIRIVAAVFSISAVTAFVLALLRLLYPKLYYLEYLDGSNLIVHYMMSGMMVLSSAIGFINSFIVINRSSSQNTGRNISTWLLLDSLFETTRVVYIFVSEVVLKGTGPLQIYEIFISIAQYLLDSFLYCQMILRH